MTTISLTRRSVLAGIGAIGVTATTSSCASNQPDPIALESGSGGTGDPQLTSELQLIALYEAMLAAFPELGEVASSIAEQHRDHARALGASLESPPEAPPESLSIPDSPAKAIDQLVVAEEAAAQERRDGCAIASDREQIRLLALIAASEASHAAELARSNA